MVIGIGVDIVEVKRIRSACIRWGDRFENRLYTPGELAHCGLNSMRYQRLACRFAAKEAAFKALGTGLAPGMDWHDVEVISNRVGKPELILTGGARRRADEIGVRQALVTLAHTEAYAVANVVLVGDETPEK